MSKPRDPEGFQRDLSPWSFSLCSCFVSGKLKLLWPRYYSSLRLGGWGQKYSNRYVPFWRQIGLQLLSVKSVASHWNGKKTPSSDTNVSVLVKFSILLLPLTGNLTLEHKKQAFFRGTGLDSVAYMWLSAVTWDTLQYPLPGLPQLVGRGTALPQPGLVSQPSAPERGRGLRWWETFRQLNQVPF